MTQISYIDSDVLKNRLLNDIELTDIDIPDNLCVYGSRSQGIPINVIYFVMDALENYPRHHKLIPECLICDEYKTITILHKDNIDKYKNMFKNSIKYYNYNIQYRDINNCKNIDNVDFSDLDIKAA